MIVISADMEGASGVTRWAQVTPGGPDYAVGVGAIARDVRVVVDTLTLAGHAVTVVDAHWACTNLTPADVAPAALLSGPSLAYDMVEGIQHPAAAGLLLVGYHGRAGAPGCLAHTWSATAFEVVTLNGRPIGEATIATHLAAAEGIPVLGVSGDDLAASAAHGCRQAQPRPGGGGASCRRRGPSPAHGRSRRRGRWAAHVRSGVVSENGK